MTNKMKILFAYRKGCISIELVLPAKEVLLSICYDIVRKIIENNKPHVWLSSPEPLFSIITGNYVGDDISGDVRKAERDDIKKMLGESEEAEFATSRIHAFLDLLKTGDKKASYVSRCGWFWISYEDVVRDYYESWKLSEYTLYNEDNDCLNEEFEYNLDILFESCLSELPLDMLYGLALKTIS